jgi:PAS domain S-box-containing protein
LRVWLHAPYFHAFRESLSTIIDMAESKQAEALADTSRRLNAVLDNATVAIFLMDDRQHCAYMNAAAERLTGYTFAETQGRPLHDVIHHTRPDGSHFPLHECAIDRAFPENAHTRGEEVFVHKDGHFYPVAFNASPVRDEASRTIGTVIEVRDISAEKAQEVALRESTQRLADERHALEVLNRTGTRIAAELELDSLVQAVVDAGVELTGAQFGAFFYNVLDGAGGKYMLFALSGAERSAFEKFGMPRATAVFAPTFLGEGVIRSADILADQRYGRNTPHSGMPSGHLPVRSYLAVPVTSRSGEVIGGLFFGHPETDVFSERSERLMSGLAAQAAIGIDNARLFQAAQRARDDLERRVEERTRELEQAHEALRQSQKMEAVGQLTGGIAHDFNNMLAVVIGSLDLLERRIGPGDARARRYVHAAAEGARRAANLTQRLLAFSRQQPLRPEPLEPNKLVAGMSDLLRHSLGSDVRLETVLAGGLWRTHADPNQLENVILNLAVNARDAMPDGGRLTVETQNAHLDERYSAAHPGVLPGQYVLIAVTDTGAGMPPDVVARAFDPFFTTKEVGKGTGLGLSMVYGFVKQSGGHVKIYSEVGHGTTVKVYLPRHSGVEAGISDGLNEDDVPLGEEREVVLVVEDEPAVRQFSVDALSELGYRVLEADGAASALRILEVHPEIGLLFTDVVMPDVNGRRLAEEARLRRPDLKVLFTTGYTRNAIVHNGVLDAGVQLIGKPYSVEQLAAKVREVLDS